MRKLLVSGLGLSLSLLTACSVNKSTSDNSPKMCVPASELQGIVGGSKVSEYSPLSKKVVFIYAEIGNEPTSCTGTPIGNDLILTAAHCVYKEGMPTSKVMVGFHPDITCESGFGPSKLINAINWTHHYDYSESRHTDDVALIKLERNIPQDYEVSEIYDGSGTITSNRVILSGYGITDESRKDAGYLRMTTKSYSDLETYGSLIKIPQSESGVCSGDSGGPAFIEINGRLKVLGVNSYVGGRTTSTVCHGSGYLMSGEKYLPWVREMAPRL